MDPAEQIAAVRFTPVRIAGGYDMDEVDTLLDRLGRAAVLGEPLAPLVAEARLRTVRWRDAYDITEVDAFLDHITGGAVRRQATAAPTGSAVQEQRGWLARLLGR